jgi:hypothetical protein
MMPEPNRQQQTTTPPTTTPPITPPVVTATVEAPAPKQRDVEERFRSIVIKLIYSVVDGSMTLSTAKKDLHAFCEDLSQADKDVLYNKASAISKRVRDIADGLTAETPSLLARLMPNQNI